MADITICLNKMCPKAAECYRATATPSEYRQSWAMFDYTLKPQSVHCDNFWPNSDLRITASATPITKES